MDESTFLTTRFNYAELRHVLTAVVDIHGHMQECHERPKPGSDDWGIITQLREEFHSRVVLRWCELTGEQIYAFPWTIDFVCHVANRYRKTKDSEKEVIRNEIAGFCVT